MATGTGNLPNPAMSFSPFAILTAEEMNNLVENINALADGSGIGDGSIGTSDIANKAVTGAKLADPVTTTDANGWSVTDYGNQKVATKTVTPGAVSKVRFETASQGSANLPVGVATAAALKTMAGEIGVGNFSDFVSITRNNTGSASTQLMYVYMYLGPTAATSYTVPVKFTVTW